MPVHLHKVDRQFKKPDDYKLQQVMTFCLLDSNSTYKQVCKGYDAIDDAYEQFSLEDGGPVPYVTWLSWIGIRGVRRILKSSGYPWYNQKARYIVKWAKSKYSKCEYLRSMPREELAKNITGIGMKLASMYVRNTRGDEVAVFDRHTIGWLKERHSWVRNRIKDVPKNWFEYCACEAYFIQDAEDMGKSPYQLDLEIWQDRRVK